jgi:murein DD-endopeptidase MepM/ murein hydrolase activator NlpD
MTYPLLAVVFFATVLFALFLVVLTLLRIVAPRRWPGAFWARRRRRILIVAAAWFGGYALFVACGTGPEDLATYPPAASSPYRLPWKPGVTRFVVQGNRSITSHRDAHLHAWDFWMPVGTEVLAARAGQVVEVEDGLDGIGRHGNFVTVEHDDGTRALYAHIRKGGAAVKLGEQVEQGQLVAFSGMVGQTLYPHLHFVVRNRDGSASIPISSTDVPGGVPRAGSFCTSASTAR